MSHSHVFFTVASIRVGKLGSLHPKLKSKSVTILNVLLGIPELLRLTYFQKISGWLLLKLFFYRRHFMQSVMQPQLHNLLRHEAVAVCSRFSFLNYCVNFFFCVGFLSRAFTNHRTAGEGGGFFINSSLPFLPALQTLKYQSGNYCRGLTSAHSQQQDLNRELLPSKSKSLTTKPRAIMVLYYCLKYDT